MASALRSVAVLAVASALAILSAPGCSQQSEGDRCDVTADCDSGLTCVPEVQLLFKGSDRCCPAESSETSERCVRVSGSNTGGTSGGGTSGGGTSGTGGASGASAGGTSAGSATEEGGASGSGGGAGEPGAGGMTVGEAGAAGAAGAAPAGAGAPAGGAGQGGVD